MVRRAVPFAVIRIFLLASVGVIGSGYAIFRYYTHPHQPMLMPVPPAPPVSTVTEPDPTDSGEIPAPELVPYSVPPSSGSGDTNQQEKQ